MTGSLAISSSQTGSVFSVSASYIDFDFDSFLFSGSTTFQGTFASTATTASFTALSATTASLTGSLLGTGSWAISSSRAISASRADSALSSSYALTASFALNAAGGAGFPFTGSAVITGSLSVIGRSNVTGSVTAANSESLFLVTQTVTQTNATGSKSYQASINPIFVNNAPNQTQTALRVNATFTGSQSGSNTQNLIADFGAANVGSQLTVNDITSGSIYMVNDVSGLPIIEATSNWDVNIYDYPNIVFKKTGSAIITSGSFTVSGSLNVTQGITGSLLGTASYAATASYIDGSDWIDYSATSTIVGWSSFTTKVIKYRIIGKQVFFNIDLNGTSNSATTSFTLPYNSNTINAINSNWSTNNGSNQLGYFITTVNTNICVGYINFSTPWTATGTKRMIGQFFIEIA